LRSVGTALAKPRSARTAAAEDRRTRLAGPDRMSFSSESHPSFWSPLIKDVPRTRPATRPRPGTMVAGGAMPVRLGSVLGLSFGGRSEGPENYFLMIPSLRRVAIAARDRPRKGPGPNLFRPPDAEPISTAALLATAALELLFRNGAIPEQNEPPRHTHGPPRQLLRVVGSGAAREIPLSRPR
jgi:hypothetical protein